MEKSIAVAHQLDAVWLIELWLRIHGGDPGPDKVVIDEKTVELATELAAHLRSSIAKGTMPALTVPMLEKRLDSLGIKTLPSHAVATAQKEAAPGQAHERCYFWRGIQVICLKKLLKPLA